MAPSEHKGAPVKRYAILSLLAAVLLVLVFGYGAYLGDRYRREVRDVAHNVLGLGLAPGADEMLDRSQVPAVDTLSARHDHTAGAPATPTTAPANGVDAGAATIDGGTAAPVASKATPAPVPGQSLSAGAAAQPVTATPGSGEAAVEPDAAPPVTQAPLDLPVTVRVKVLVDDTYVRSHPDWPSQVQRMLALASDAYRNATRIEFELVAIARFATTLDGLGEPAVHALLAKQDRDGADVVLALVDRDPATTTCSAQPIGPTRQGTRGLVGYGDSRLGPLPQVLRCLGVLLGGQVNEDAGSEAVRLGSWMGPLKWTQRRWWLDGDNRARIMARKTLPFVEDGR